MSSNTYAKTVFWFGILGVLFSGYLSGTKLLTSTCAFNEPCPYFLGYPACFFGFGIFLVIFLVALAGFRGLKKKTVGKIETFFSLVGILFAGQFALPEISKLLSGAKTIYTLGFPTCVYGLIFYIIIFVLSIYYLLTTQDL